MVGEEMKPPLRDFPATKSVAEIDDRYARRLVLCDDVFDHAAHVEVVMSKRRTMLVVGEVVFGKEGELDRDAQQE